jgi:uncharacterized protein
MEGGKDSPVIVILHGLEGSSNAPYVRSALGEARKMGWRAVAMNFRSCSGEPNRLKQSYHSGKTEDLDFVLKYLIENEKADQIYLVGFSVGGNIVLKWLGEQGDQNLEEIRKAVVVSVPFDLAKSAAVMDQGFNREVYTRSLLAGLKAKALLKEERFPGLIARDKVKHVKTFKLFDREVTAPINGFKNEKDYWFQSSSVHYLDQIRVPTLIIHAKDDPFFPDRLIPYEQIRKSPYLTPLIVDHGGHLGFVSGPWPWKQDMWLERTIVGYLNKRLR